MGRAKITTGSLVCLVYRDPCIPTEVDMSMIRKWGEQYMPMCNTDIGIAVNVEGDDKSYVVRAVDGRAVTDSIDNIINQQHNLFCIIIKELDISIRKIINVFNNWTYICDTHQPSSDEITIKRVLESGKQVKVKILHKGISDTLKPATHAYAMINVDSQMSDNTSKLSQGQLFLYQDRVYVEYNVFNTNYITVNSLQHLQQDVNIDTIDITYDGCYDLVDKVKTNIDRKLQINVSDCTSNDDNDNDDCNDNCIDHCTNKTFCWPSCTDDWISATATITNNDDVHVSFTYRNIDYNVDLKQHLVCNSKRKNAYFTPCINDVRFV